MGLIVVCSVFLLVLCAFIFSVNQAKPPTIVTNVTWSFLSSLIFLYRYFLLTLEQSIIMYIMSRDNGCSNSSKLNWSKNIISSENIALRRPAAQSSVYYEPHETSRPLNLAADYAVDGKVSNYLLDSPCSHTDGGDITPSWTVFLNASRHDKVHRMKLYLRKSCEFSGVLYQLW